MVSTAARRRMQQEQARYRLQRKSCIAIQSSRPIIVIIGPQVKPTLRKRRASSLEWC